MSSHNGAATQTKPRLASKKRVVRNAGAAAARAKIAREEDQLATKLLHDLKVRGDELTLKINALLARVS